MALVPLDIPPGINSDDTTFDATGRWSDANNVRFRLGEPETIGGAVSKFDLGAAGATDLFAFSRSGTDTIAYGAPSQAYVGSLSSATSRLSGVGALGGFSFAAWGSTLLIAPRGGSASAGGTLYQQSGSSAAAAVVGAPARIDAGIIVTPQRQVLAFNTNEESGGAHNPLCIRGSDLEDYTVWTTSATNNAFEHILDGPGAIVCARQVGAYVAVWTTGALHLGTFVGNPGQAYRFDKVADVARPMAPRATAELNGVVYWMGSDWQLRAWVPGAPPQIVPSPILRDWSDNCSSPNEFTYLVANQKFGEIWVFYKDGRDGGTYPSRYVAYAAEESRLAGRPVWFKGELARSAMFDSEIVHVLDTTNGLSTLASADDGQIYTHGGGSGVGTLPSWHAQWADQYIDSSRRRMMIKTFIPDFEQHTASLDLTLYVRDRPLSTATTKGPYAIATSATKKDLRASGKIIAGKFSGSGHWRMGKPLFDAVPLGER